MRPITYIWHVTLNTGHGLRQYRRDIGDAASAAIAETLDGLLQGTRMPVPGRPGYLLTGASMGHDLLVNVWRGPWERRHLLLTSGTALKSRSARDLWQAMHDQAPMPLATHRGDVPRAPWVADLIAPEAALHPDALAWTGDLARCMAWAWAEYRAASTTP